MTPVEALRTALATHDGLEDVLAGLAKRGFWLAPMEADEGMQMAGAAELVCFDRHDDSATDHASWAYEAMRDDYLGRGK